MSSSAPAPVGRISGRLTGLLKVIVHGARDLASKQMIGMMDPYIIAKLKNEKLKSSVHKDGGRMPRWEHTFIFNLKDYDDHEIIHFEVMNKELVSDDTIGLASIELNQLVTYHSIRRWYQLVDKSNFSKIAGAFEATVDYSGTGVEWFVRAAAPQPATAPAAAAVAAIAAPAPAPAPAPPVYAASAPAQPVAAATPYQPPAPVAAAQPYSPPPQPYGAPPQPYGAAQPYQPPAGYPPQPYPAAQPYQPPAAAQPYYPPAGAQSYAPPPSGYPAQPYPGGYASPPPQPYPAYGAPQPYPAYGAPPQPQVVYAAAPQPQVVIQQPSYNPTALAIEAAVLRAEERELIREERELRREELREEFYGGGGYY